jgi:hypothetical protein
MRTSDYAEKIVKLIQARPRGINADKLLYEIYIKFKVAEGLRAVREGRVYSHKQVVEDMWKIINPKSSGAAQQKGTSRKSSPKSAIRSLTS